MFNEEFITWNLAVVVVGIYGGLCGCQSGTVKSDEPSGKLLRKCKTNWRLLEELLKQKIPWNYTGRERTDKLSKDYIYQALFELESN